jgi:cell division transport system ATP-binding protein
MIQFEQVSKTYPGGHAALKNLSFKIDKGEMIFLAGHSGAGKSTILKLIAGITKPSEGVVRLNQHVLGDLSTTIWAFCANTSASCFKTTKFCSTAMCSPT